MNFISLFLIAIYTTIVVILIWARYFFFKVSSKSSAKGSRFYDPAVAIHVLATFYLASRTNWDNLVLNLLGCILYIAGISLFLWAISTAKKLDFAFSDNVDTLVTTGAYGIVRHPLYLSYSIIWFSSSLVFNSYILWITLLYLIAFYYLSARKEEEVILNSEHSGEYRDYKNKVGMFFPRITK